MRRIRTYLLCLEEGEKNSEEGEKNSVEGEKNSEEGILSPSPSSSSSDGDSDTTTSLNEYSDLPRKVICDTYINPEFIVQNGIRVDYLQKALQCCICKKLSTDALFECESRGHVFCSGCYQFVQNNKCFCRNSDGGSACAGKVSHVPTSIVRNLVQHAHFLCVNPNCGQTVKGGAAWAAHIVTECSRRGFLRCPDSGCNGLVLKNTYFASHCKRHHGVPSFGESFVLTLNIPSVSSGEAGRQWIAGIINIQRNILYIVADLVQPNLINLSCFTVWRDEEVTSLKVQISVHTEDEFGPKICAYTKVNLSARDQNEVKYFGRSVSFFTSVLDQILKCNEGPDKERSYQFEVKLMKDFPVDKALDSRSPAESETKEEEKEEVVQEEVEVDELQKARDSLPSRFCNSFTLVGKAKAKTARTTET